MDGAVSTQTHNQRWKMADFAFLQKQYNPFYRLPTGKNSNYSDQLFVTLSSIAETGKFDMDHWKKSLYEAFGAEDNEYQTSRKLREEPPVKGPWLHTAMIDFCKKIRGQNGEHVLSPRR